MTENWTGEMDLFGSLEHPHLKTGCGVLCLTRKAGTNISLGLTSKPCLFCEFQAYERSCLKKTDSK